jgi:hypothetical protein
MSKRALASLALFTIVGCTAESADTDVHAADAAGAGGSSSGGAGGTGGSVVLPVVDAGSSPIAQAAAALQAGQSTTSLGANGLTQASLYTIQWENRFHYDHAHGLARLLGKNASSQGSERSHSQYDVQANRWAYAIYGGSELGHIYESQGYDAATSDIYTGTWGQNTLKKWSFGSPLEVWIDPATADFGSTINPDTQPMLAWHPNLFGAGDGGILALQSSGTTATVIAWHKSTNAWSTLASTSHTVNSNSYISYGVVEYVRGGDFALAAFDPGGSGKTFRVAAGSGGALGALTEISPVPIRCGYAGDGDNVGILIDDPTGAPTPYILEKGGSNRVWRYGNGTWTLEAYAHPLPAGGPTTDTSWTVASCYPLGVFWSLRNTTQATSMLWRPND